MVNRWMNSHVMVGPGIGKQNFAGTRENMEGLFAGLGLGLFVVLGPVVAALCIIDS